MSNVLPIFGELTFNKKVMSEKLSNSDYEKLLAVISTGNPLDEGLAASVAHAMKEWAIAEGATHFTHWFQPQRGGTAEKHDAFLTYAGDGEVIERFSAKQLIQSEPDASSFPSGGIRSTFEARGYTAWDPTSPAFLLETGTTKTLVIPSVFLSWTGDVLDLKTPILRSLRVLNDAGLRLQKMLGNSNVTKLRVFAGLEQEYFVVSKALYNGRPDLRVCGRTIFGAAPAKGQQMEDHYFGTIHPRVVKFMEDLDRELYRRGIPAKTRHNEVSPNQFEIAPLYEEMNLAIDHNLQIMDIMRRVADRHSLVALLHEKPFAGVNGSGKHLNWSIGDDVDANYLDPSMSPSRNLNFLITLGAIMLGVDRFGDLLRASVADAGNDHRLGANEAPPAIMSIYLGEYLTKIINEIADMGEPTEQQIAHINMGVKNLPLIARDYSDRNRTSPIAFTGNKFEFRAVGSSQNPSEAAMTLNVLVAYGYSVIEQRIAALGDGIDARERAMVVLRDIFRETRHVCYEGNGYSQDWHQEAARRGLSGAKNTPSALLAYVRPEVVGLMQRLKILSETEISAKVEIKLETYVKVKKIEMKCAVDIAKTKVLPAIMQHLQMCASVAQEASAVCSDVSVLAREVCRFSSIFANVRTKISDLERLLIGLDGQHGDLAAEAGWLADVGEGALKALREAVDAAEQEVASDFWPMVRYQDLLTVL